MKTMIGAAVVMLSAWGLPAATPALAQVTAQVVTPVDGQVPIGTDTPAVAGQSDARTEAVKQRFRERFGNMPVTEVRHTAFGLFEVQLGNSLVYTDEPVTFVLDGHLIDASTRQDITEQRLQDLAKIDFNTLPLELAITQVRGDGSRKMAIFEDPNCGYCKQLRRNMEGIDDLTVYTFLLPILSADSAEKVKNIWCATEQGEVLDQWMLNGKVPPKLSCEAPLEKFRQLGQTLMVQGTPAIFFADGSRVPGAISKEELIKRLQQ
jgi:thiol:disulfide interchange protein DsbC